MSLKVGINGFGRIGRNAFRAALANPSLGVEIVAVNDLTNPETLAHLLKYDSVHGNLPHEISATEGDLLVNGSPISVFSERDPADLRWGDNGIDVVIESTGFFTERSDAEKHIKSGGARKVIISAPAKGEDITIVRGVNEDSYDKDAHHIISNASCTTNCLAPVVKVLHEKFGIVHGYMTTIHAFTGDQSVLDTFHPDLRRARAASMSMIPTSTGAAKAVGLVMPELSGKLDGTAIRVPTPNVSLIDFKFVSKKTMKVDSVNKAMTAASRSNKLKGILNVNSEPLVSSDFNHNPASSNFDLTQTQVIEGKFGRVLSWYDNEWGFSNRMCDTAVAMKRSK